jgi:DNA-binding SARP family transcriptional activator
MDGRVTAVALRAQLFGDGAVSKDGQPVLLTDAGTALLSYLLLHGGSATGRGELIEVVAPGPAPDLARRRLNTAVWRLRRSLEARSELRDSVVVTRGGALTINPECGVWVDALEFARACEPSHRPVDTWSAADAASVTRGLSIYEGELLAAFPNDWIVQERERFAQLRLASIVRLSDWHRRCGADADAIAFAERAVVVAPLRDDLQRRLIELYRGAGLHDLAAHQTAKARELFRTELDVEPQFEASVLPTSPALTMTGAQRTEILATLAELREVRDELARTYEHVDHAVGRMQQLLRGPRPS